jgi:hypothetical protein
MTQALITIKKILTNDKWIDQAFKWREKNGL